MEARPELQNNDLRNKNKNKMDLDELSAENPQT